MFSYLYFGNQWHLHQESVPIPSNRAAVFSTCTCKPTVFSGGVIMNGGRADLKLLAQTAHSPAQPLMSCFHCLSFAGTMTRTFRNSGHNVLVAFVGSVFLLHTTGECSWLAQTDSNYLTILMTSASPCRAFTTSSYPSPCVVLSFGMVKIPHVELSGINSNHLFQVCPNPLFMGFHRSVYAYMPH